MKNKPLIALLVFTVATAGILLSSPLDSQADRAQPSNAVEAESFQIENAPEIPGNASAAGLPDLVLFTSKTAHLSRGATLNLQIKVKNIGDAIADREEEISQQEGPFGGSIGIKYEVLPIRGIEPELTEGSYRSGYLYASGPLSPEESKTVRLSISTREGEDNRIAFTQPGIYVLKLTVDPPTSNNIRGSVTESDESNSVYVAIDVMKNKFSSPSDEIKAVIEEVKRLDQDDRETETAVSKKLQQILEEELSPLPDLRIDAPPQIVAQPGEDFYVPVTILNGGDGIAFEGGGPSQNRRGVRFRYRVFDPETGEVLLQSGVGDQYDYHTMNPIEPGGQETITFAILAYEDVLLFQRPGVYAVEFFADPISKNQTEGLVKESNENNNSLTVEIVILPGIANLTVSAPETVQAKPGEEIELPITVKNIGRETALGEVDEDNVDNPLNGRIKIKYQILHEPDQKPTSSEDSQPAVGYLYTSGPIEPKQEETVRLGNQTGTDSISFKEPGTYRIRLTVDPSEPSRITGFVPEWNEYDNRSIIEVVVR